MNKGSLHPGGFTSSLFHGMMEKIHQGGSAMSEKITYQEIHAYMLKKTQEYYQDPPQVLIQATAAKFAAQGQILSPEEARKAVSLIDIQRYLKEEMSQKWPEFMGTIPQNSLKD